MRRNYTDEASAQNTFKVDELEHLASYFLQFNPSYPNCDPTRSPMNHFFSSLHEIREPTSGFRPGEPSFQPHYIGRAFLCSSPKAPPMGAAASDGIDPETYPLQRLLSPRKEAPLSAPGGVVAYLKAHGT